MNKLFLIFTCALLLTGCAEKESYRQAVLVDMQSEQDIKDYAIDPERITDCVMDVSAGKMPGIGGIDPKRLVAYRDYTKMLSMKTVKDEKTFAELRSAFPSHQALLTVRNNYTESVMNCINAIIMESEPEAEPETDPAA